jgi:hypothetical protein
MYDDDDGHDVMYDDDDDVDDRVDLQFHLIT